VHAGRSRKGMARSCDPELVPLRCCLRLCETTPVPLVRVLSLLAQCAPGVWRYRPQSLKERSLVQIPPRSAVQRFRAACIHNSPCFDRQAGLKGLEFSRMLAQEQPTISSPQPLDTMAPVIKIGRRIVQSDQAGRKRVQYGDVLIKRLANDLSASFGRGFGARNLAQMRSFYLVRPEGKIVQTPSAQSQALRSVAIVRHRNRAAARCFNVEPFRHCNATALCVCARCAVALSRYYAVIPPRRHNIAML
jgi:hypothetical protein